MPVELLAVTATDAGIIETLLNDYLQELSRHRDVPVGATDSASYPYLSLYWSEPGRHPFLIRLQNDRLQNDHYDIVGFVLVRDPTSVIGCSGVTVGQPDRQAAHSEVCRLDRRMNSCFNTVLILMTFPLGRNVALGCIGNTSRNPQ